MEYLSKLFIFLFWVSCAGAGQYYSHLKNGIKATVEHIVLQHERAERSPRGRETVFKETMDFTVTLESGQVIYLHLKLNENQIGKVLVKVISEDGTEFFDNTKPKDYRFYQMIGDGHGASVMVRCENFQPPCYLAGSFYYNSVEYVIDPDTDIAHKVSAVPHTAYETNPGNGTHAYDHDMVKVVTDGSDQDKRKHPSDTLLDLLKLYRGRKTKRATSKKQYKIELEMVVDDSIYAFWLERMSNNSDAAIEKIEQYMEQVANNMDLRYSTASTSTMEIDIVPLIITVIKDRSKNGWITENIVNEDSDGGEAFHAETALNALYLWATKNRNPKSDALLCFSRRDMWSGGQKSGEGTAGIARLMEDRLKNPVSSLCTDNAISLNENLRSGDTSSVSSHELGHNMGLYHDSMYNDEACKDEKLYIMAGMLGFVSNAADAKNPWSFSSCSVSEMERLMSTIPKNTEGKTCLERHSYDVTEYNKIRTSDLLGELYSTDQQCEMIIGQGSKHCKNTRIKEDEICWKGIPCSTLGRSCPVIQALSGSSCGGTKKCYQGKCVDALPQISTEPVPKTFSSSSPSTTASSTSSSSSTTTSSTTSTTSTTSSTTSTTPAQTSSTSTTPSTTTSTTSPTTSTTTSTTSSTTSTTTSTYPTTKSSSSPTETSTSPAFTEQELAWLRYFSRRCYYCNCWRYFCWYFNQIPLCQRFASVCYA